MIPKFFNLNWKKVFVIFPLWHFSSQDEPFCDLRPDNKLSFVGHEFCQEKIIHFMCIYPS